MVRWRWFTLGLIVCLTIGCGGGPPLREVVNPDPSGKIPAIKDAVQQKDMSAVRQLVRDLDSDDPAVRFYAIQGLERLTGQTFGYQYFDDEIARRGAVAKWNAWLLGWESGQREQSGP